MKKLLIIIASFLGIFCGWEKSSPAYKFQYTPTKKPARWFKRDIYYKINPYSLKISPEIVRDEIKKSFLTWEVALGSKLRFHFVGYSRLRATKYQNADKKSVNSNVTQENLLFWESRQWPVSPEAAAFTTVTYRSDTGEILDADIIFNAKNFQWTVLKKCKGVKNLGCTGKSSVKNTAHTSENRSVDIRTIAIHEIGHFLGLSHSDDPSAIMFPFRKSTKERRRTLSPDDIAGINSLYSSPVPPPNDGKNRSGLSDNPNPYADSNDTNSSQSNLTPPPFPPFGFGCTVAPDISNNVTSPYLPLILISIFILFKNRQKI